MEDPAIVDAAVHAHLDVMIRLGLRKRYRPWSTRTRLLASASDLPFIAATRAAVVANAGDTR